MRCCVGAMRAQAEAFARWGGPCEGASGDDAVRALTVPRGWLSHSPAELLARLSGGK